jgi:formate-dependent nitrite reductase membrane component NrfD
MNGSLTKLDEEALTSPVDKIILSWFKTGISLLTLISLFYTINLIIMLNHASNGLVRRLMRTRTYYLAIAVMIVGVKITYYSWAVIGFKIYFQHLYGDTSTSTQDYFKL